MQTFLWICHLTTHQNFIIEHTTSLSTEYYDDKQLLLEESTKNNNAKFQQKQLTIFSNQGNQQQ
jgi:hypothetical protein